MTRVGRVFRLENDFGALAVQPVAHGLAIEDSNHNVVIHGLSASIHDYQVSGEQAGAGHTVALDLRQVHMRSTDVEQFIQGMCFSR
jgi:hypothetical protein